MDERLIVEKKRTRAAFFGDAAGVRSAHNRVVRAHDHILGAHGRVLGALGRILSPHLAFITPLAPSHRPLSFAPVPLRKLTLSVYIDLR